MQFLNTASVRESGSGLWFWLSKSCDPNFVDFHVYVLNEGVHDPIWFKKKIPASGT